MRIATFDVQGRRRVGAVSEDGQSVTPFVLDEVEAGRGALTLIERHPACDGTPQLSGERFALVDVQLEAPLPMPRRNLFCVGRNYHAHAKELSGSVFKSAPKDTQSWPIVFTKVPECVVGPYDEVRLPGAEVSSQIDYEAELAVVIGRGGAQHPAWGGARARVRLHDRQRRHRARRPDAPPAVGPRQVVRHLLPDGTVDRDRRRASTARTRACAAGSTASRARTPRPPT